MVQGAFDNILHQRSDQLHKAAEHFSSKEPLIIIY